MLGAASVGGQRASTDDTEVRARAAGARVINLPQRLGFGVRQTGREGSA